MGKKTILMLLLLVLANFGLYHFTVNDQSNHKMMFSVWKNAHSKQYDNPSEEQFRFKIWLLNFNYVKEHNLKYAAGEETYELEMNAFADLTSDQFAEKYLIKQVSGGSVGNTKECTGKQADGSVPDEVDWSAKGAVTGIKNQGQCGSCWAFSTTGSLEGAHYLVTKNLASFSEQQLVDCSKSYGNMGCGGGLMNSSFFYVKDNGITLENKYPYKGIGGACHYKPESDKAWTISDCTEVTADSQSALMKAIAQQPVSVAIQANHLSFQLYKRGVYSGNCGTNLDHGVLAVGYGKSDGKPYYKVKNSWGASWGNQGFIFIQRTGDGKGKCGIQMAASFPIA